MHSLARRGALRQVNTSIQFNVQMDISIHHQEEGSSSHYLHIPSSNTQKHSYKPGEMPPKPDISARNRMKAKFIAIQKMYHAAIEVSIFLDKNVYLLFTRRAMTFLYRDEPLSKPNSSPRNPKLKSFRTKLSEFLDHDLQLIHSLEKTA
jgi:hypothetical protein